MCKYIDKRWSQTRILIIFKSYILKKLPCLFALPQVNFRNMFDEDKWNIFYRFMILNSFVVILTIAIIANIVANIFASSKRRKLSKIWSLYQPNNSSQRTHLWRFFNNGWTITIQWNLFSVHCHIHFNFFLKSFLLLCHKSVIFRII